MKKIFYSALFIVALSSCDSVLKSAGTIGRDILSTPTTDEASGGLKEALKQGVSNGVNLLNAKGGFNNSSLYRIFLPPEAVNIEKKLRAIGLGAEVDKVIVTMNEGAESAVAEAKPIFVNAITQMSFQDAMGILTGGKGSATNYLKNSTTAALIEAFKPKVQVALDKVGFTKNWSDLVNTYNKIPTVQKLNPDLNGYITGQAVTALFQQVEIEENNIRDNPAARGTALLKKVFSYADTKKTN